IPLAEIATVSEVRMFNGKLLWWKRGFVLDLKNGRRIGVAVPEPYGRHWRAKLSGGTLPELPRTESEKPANGKTARKVTKGEFMGVGCAIQAFGLACFFIPYVGLPLGVILLVIGGRLALKLVCSGCRREIDKDDQACPHCRALFVAPRFSRTAIVGANLAIAALALGIFYPALIGHPSSSDGAGKLLVVAFELLALVLAGFATSLGWVAVSQIRRSAGKLHGLWLAVFDGLLFPMLAVDALIFVAWYLLCNSVWAHPNDFSAIDTGAKLWVTVTALAAISCCAVDFLIIRRVWHAVNNSIASTPGGSRRPEAQTANTESESASAGRPRAVWFAIVVLGVFALLKISATPLVGERALIHAALFGVMLTGLYWRARWAYLLVLAREANTICDTAAHGLVLTGVPGISSHTIFPVSAALFDSALVVVTVLMSTRWFFPATYPERNRQRWLWATVAAVMLAALAGAFNPLPPMTLNLDPLKPKAEQANSKLSFGPVVERVITVGNDARSFYSLDRADYVPGPTEFDPTDHERHDDFWKWNTKNHVDIFSRQVNGKPMLFRSEMVWVFLNEEDFDPLTPEQLEANPTWQGRATQIRNQESNLASRGKWHGDKDTFAFENRFGVVGLMQVTGITSEPPGVIVRYKLVQNAPALPQLGREAARELAWKAKREGISTLGFRAVQECILQDRTDKANGQGVDFDSAVVVTPPPLEQMAFDWREKHGVDFYADGINLNDGSRGQGLYTTRGTAADGVPSNRWETMAAEDVVLRALEVEPGTRDATSVLCYETTSPGQRPVFPVTYIFHTREGTSGIMQVLGHTENPRGVKIRYKLVQSGKPTPLVEPVAQKLSFGPVVERVVKDSGESRNSAYLDFESGALVAPPAELQLTNSDALWDWAVGHGVDVVANTSSGELRGLLGYGLTAAELPNEDWDAPSLDRLRVAIGKRRFSDSKYGGLPPRSQSVLSVNTISTKTNASKTWAFQTQNGTEGLLQFLEYTDSPGGSVKIRYKLVQNGEATGATAQPDQLKPISAEAVAAYREFQEFLHSKQPREFADPDTSKKLHELINRFSESLRGTQAEPLWLKAQQTSLDQRRAFARGDTAESQRLDKACQQLEKELQVLLEQAGAPKYPDSASASDSRGSKAAAMPSPSNTTAIFGRQSERTLAARLANGDGVVGFRFSDNDEVAVPESVTGHFRDLKTRGFTPELQQWMRDNRVDMVFHFADKFYDALWLDMRNDFVAQPKEWDTVSPDKAAPALKWMEEHNTQPGPGISSGAGYKDGPTSVQVFRTREGFTGYYQLRAFADMDGHGVFIRSKQILPQKAEANAARLPGSEFSRAVADAADYQSQCLISLDTGSVSVLPEELKPKLDVREPSETDETFIAWMRERQADAVARFVITDGKVVRFGLRTFGVIALPLHEGRPEQISPEAAGKRLDKSLTEWGMMLEVNDLMTEPGKPVAFLVQNRSGRRGILRITGFEERPRGVNIHFRLTRTGKEDHPAQKAAVEPAAQKLSFGPVMERVIEPTNSDRRALNLAFGNFISPGPGRKLDFSEAGTNTLRAAGVDLFAEEGGFAGVLMSLDMRLCGDVTPGEPDKKPFTMDDFTVEQFELSLVETEKWRLSEEASPEGRRLGKYFNLRQPLSHITSNGVYFFITRNDVKGMLQTFPDPRGVKVRYKLLQPNPALR
ncbi:MAG: hypothetical protein WCS94_17915, partial [Verrucomicrobiota bacterium]